jgi:hypothetical protein
VAMTRARSSLVLSHVSSRAVFGMLHPRAPSPFLDAIPHDLAPRRTILPVAKKAPPGRRQGRGWGTARWGAAPTPARTSSPGRRDVVPPAGRKTATAAWGASGDDLPF